MNVTMVFSRPFEVTQFWISTQFDSHGKGDDDGYILLKTISAKQGKWYLEVALGKDKWFVGDFVPPFLPTRQNIAILNAAVISMTEIAQASERADDFMPPAVSPLAGIQASPVPVTRDISDERYRKALFDVLAVDWGIILPLAPSNFGKEIIRLKYRYGLPCGPAMVTAVQPILEAVWGPIVKQRVATGQCDGMTIDTVTYSGKSFTGRNQIFEITEFFGKNLHNNCFGFYLDDPSIFYVEGADLETIQSASNTAPSLTKQKKFWWKFWD